MIGWIKKAYLKARLYRLRKDQYESTALRRIFRESFDIDVGLYSYGCFDQWRMPGPMTIGRYCSIAASVRVVPASHPYSALSTHPALYDKRFGVVNTEEPHKERLFIGDDVWIGHNAIILPSCKSIGRGAVIGAGSTVTRNVPSYTIVAGVPARIIRDRFDPDLKAAIEESQWWTLDMGALASLAKSRPDLLSLPTPERLRAWRKSTPL